MFFALLPLARTVLPQILKTAGLSALSGAVSGGIEKAISGSGLFSIPQNKVDQLIKYKDYLTEAQRKQINQALQTASGISRFRLTKKTTTRHVSWYFISFYRNTIDNECFDRKGTWERTSC